MSGISNNEIKRLRSLAMKKFRDQTGLFIVEGEKMVSEALSSSFKVENIYRIEDIGQDAMSKISSLASPSPVLAVVRKPENMFLDAPKAKNLPCGLYLALDSMRDPGNLGTVLRIADWFGVDAVFASGDTVDIFNPKTVQATMGAIFRVRFQYADIPSLAASVCSSGGKVYGTFLDGRNIYERELETGENTASVIIIGNESEGISATVAENVSDRLYIPPYPAGDTGSESLNAAVAAAVTVAEFRRRMYRQR